MGVAWVCEMGLAALAWWRRHGVGSSKISSSHLAFWQLHSRRGQRKSLWVSRFSLCLFFSALGFLFFFSFVFPFGLWLGLHFWSKLFIYLLFLFLTCGWPGGLIVYNFRGPKLFVRGPSLFFFFFGWKLTYLKKKFWA